VETSTEKVDAVKVDSLAEFPKILLSLHFNREPQRRRDEDVGIRAKRGMVGSSVPQRALCCSQYVQEHLVALGGRDANSLQNSRSLVSLASFQSQMTQSGEDGDHFYKLQHAMG
jgi:hypothetical protein